METIYLGLGSNLGDRVGNIHQALDLLSAQMKIKEISSIYETEPVGYSDQDWFLNLVLKGATGLDPIEMLTFTKSIESQLGRKESFRNAPRPIDIDILFFGDRIISLKEITIPHTGIVERGFVLIPLTEIAPEFVHPQNGKTVRDLLSELEDPKQVKEWGYVSRIR